MSSEETTYLEAVTEIDGILAEVEGDGELDIDQLAGKVERAAQLIQLCSDRLKHAETRVRKVTEELVSPREVPADNGSSGNSGSEGPIGHESYGEPSGEAPISDDDIPF